MKFYFCIFLFALFACNSADSKVSTEPDTGLDTIHQEPSKNFTDERSNWQKPEFIINSLGNLEGKTLADLGSGALGYFVFKIIGRTAIEKVIAIDIDEEAIHTLNVLKSALGKDKSDKIDIRLAETNDPKLLDNEVDILLIVNTIAYLPNRLEYLKSLKSKLKDGGKIIIVDFKTKRIPEYVDAPPYSERIYLDIIEEELYQAGYQDIITDDTTLEFQYYISASK